MTTILFGSKLYKVTAEDRLWLLRAVQYEGAIENQVAQVLVNCFALERSKPRRPFFTLTLTKFVRAYAQPVNPSWFVNGKVFKKWNAIDPVKYPMGAAIKRQNVNSKRTVFDADVVAAVDRALEHGPVDIPLNATDYAASWIDADHKYTSLTKPEKGVNRLWTRTPVWAGYKVSSTLRG